MNEAQRYSPVTRHLLAPLNIVAITRQTCRDADCSSPPVNFGETHVSAWTDLRNSWNRTGEFSN